MRCTAMDKSTLMDLSMTIVEVVFYSGNKILNYNL